MFYVEDGTAKRYFFSIVILCYFFVFDKEHSLDEHDNLCFLSLLNVYSNVLEGFCVISQVLKITCLIVHSST